MPCGVRCRFFLDRLLVPLVMDRSDTIAALATPPGSGGISIIRLSGPEAHAVGSQLFRPKNSSCTFEPNRLYFGWIHHREQVLDEVLYVRFAPGRSYTREEVVEIHLHGGLQHSAQVLEAVFSCGVRPANPGEFTMRAFLNGRIDLTRAEAVTEVIEARTRSGLRAARRQLTGELARQFGNLREQLLEILVEIESYIDFPDEDIEGGDRTRIDERLGQASHFLSQARDSYRTGRILKDGAEVVLAGRPNVGKSSLLNLLVGRERAIVTELPGTTRDMLEEIVELDGLPLRFVDTAGLREGGDRVEREGVARAEGRLLEADLVLGLLDRSNPLTPQDLELIEKLPQDRTLWIANKSDLQPAWETEDFPSKEAPLDLSAKTGEGLEAMTAAIRRYLDFEGVTHHEVLLTSSRHRALVAKGAEALERAKIALQSDAGLELVAADLRDVLDGLEELLGVTSPDEVLHEIFGRFCIGK